MAEHKDLTTGAMHIIHNWNYVDLAELNSATGFISEDLHKVAFVEDPGTFYVLSSIDPEWLPIEGSLVVEDSTGATSISANTLIFPSGTVTASGTGVATINLSVEIPDWLFCLDSPKSSIDTPDDEFDSTTLDAKWTVVDGSAGTVSLVGTGGDIYDLSTRPGWLLMQSDNGNHIKIRQDYTLPDGYSIVFALSPTTTADGQSGILNNQSQLGVSVNDSDTDFVSGNYTDVIWDTNDNGWRILGGGNVAGTFSTPSAPSNLASAPIAQKVYFRISRVNLTYYPFWSTDGTAWMPLGPGNTASSAYNNIWIANVSLADMGNPTPITAVDWVRQGGNGVDPW